MLTAYYASQWSNRRSWQPHIPTYQHIERAHQHPEFDDQPCRGIMRLIFVVHEDRDPSTPATRQEFVYTNVDTMHDAGTFAVYMCTRCGHAHVQWVQR